MKSFETYNLNTMRSASGKSLRPKSSLTDNDKRKELETRNKILRMKLVGQKNEEDEQIKQINMLIKEEE